MNHLLIKLSSLGDVVQTFPAASDLRRHCPDIRLEWAIEEAYEPLVALHPAVTRTIPVAFRRWRSALVEPRSWREASLLCRTLKASPYRTIVDAQGLLKSLAIAKMARGPIYGFGPKTVREAFVSRFYDRSYEFPLEQHRVSHYRGLVAQVFGYDFDARVEAIDYGLRLPAKPLMGDAPYCVLLHSTARAEKLWPETHWIELGRQLRDRGIACALPWGNETERLRAARLSADIPDALVMPRLSMEEAAGLLAHASGVIGVDTGLLHLAVAYKVPVIGIYVATRPGHHGPLGAGPTAFCGGMDMRPTVTEVFETAKRLLPGLG